jgi:hypothetical protein
MSNRLTDLYKRFVVDETENTARTVDGQEDVFADVIDVVRPRSMCREHIDPLCDGCRFGLVTQQLGGDEHHDVSFDAPTSLIGLVQQSPRRLKAVHLVERGLDPRSKAAGSPNRCELALVAEQLHGRSIAALDSFEQADDQLQRFERRGLGLQLFLQSSCAAHLPKRDAYVHIRRLRVELIRQVRTGLGDRGRDLRSKGNAEIAHCRKNRARVGWERFLQSS